MAGEINVCAMEVGTKTIGQACEVDLDCTTKNCQILSIGYCKDYMGTLCIKDKDCPNISRVELGKCMPDPAYVFGSCTKNCWDPFNSGACPESGVCANIEGGYMCLPPCSSDGDCWEEQGFKCMAGGDQPSEIYACVQQNGGEVGSACKSGSECDVGECIPADCPEGSCDPGPVAGGYCSKQCNYDPFSPGSLGCTFPGVCVLLGSHGYCLKRCVNKGDCREGYACRTVGPSVNVCWRPD